MTPLKSNYTFAELQGLVIDWAVAKPITDLNAQTLKIYEELGELSKAILRKDEAQIIDGIGDVAVTIVIANHLANYDPLQLYKGSYLFTKESIIVGNIFKYVVEFEYNISLNLLAFLANYLGYDFVDCLATAYHVIKDRKGTMQNGSFVKEQEGYDFIKPDHYKNESGFDVIDVWQYECFNAELGTILKYLARLGKKPTDSKVQDCKKILEYINRFRNPKNLDLSHKDISEGLSQNEKVQLAIQHLLLANHQPLFLNNVEKIVKEILSEHEIN